MDVNTIIIFILVWVAATALIIVGCKLFARYCYKPRFGPSRRTQERGNQSLPLDTVIQIHNGSDQNRLFRQRSYSMPVVDSTGRRFFPASRNAGGVEQLPPDYALVLSHPSIYKKKQPASRQGTLPPPPHYDDLDLNRTPSFTRRASDTAETSLNSLSMTRSAFDIRNRET